MKGDLETEKVAIDDVRPHPKNVRQGDIGAICESLTAHGQYRAIVAQRSTGHILAGNHTWKAAKQLGWKHITTHFIDCDDDGAMRILLADNRANDLASYDDAALAAVLAELNATDLGLAGTLFDGDALDQLIGDIGREETAADAPDDAPAITQVGDIWLLGEHRLMCGDSTKIDDVTRLMNGKKAQLLHADPPYGMGKEDEGVLNDNLRNSDLDQFQMSWWNTCRKFVADNGSAYIWGNPADLWRLWYVGGLKDSEKLTMQNELVWSKPSGFGQSSDLMISFPISTERCLFFQFGHQFVGNVNIDDFPEEWESLRSYLASEADKAGIKPSDIKKVCGVQMYGHWFSKSQFHLIGENHYQRLADHYEGCFLRSWSELKAEWDSTLGIMLDRKHHKLGSLRSYFNNAHDNMNEVWEFGRVTGSERHEHATPKPVPMMIRIMKSSAPPDSITLEPFAGSGSTLIAAQLTNRICYTMELDTHYCDIICARYQKQTGNLPQLEATGDEHNFLL